MIIKRIYKYFWRLVDRDPKAQEIIEKACSYHQPTKKEAKRIYEYNMQNRAFELQLGCEI